MTPVPPFNPLLQGEYYLKRLGLSSVISSKTFKVESLAIGDEWQVAVRRRGEDWLCGA